MLQPVMRSHISYSQSFFRCASFETSDDEGSGYQKGRKRPNILNELKKQERLLRTTESVETDLTIPPLPPRLVPLISDLNAQGAEYLRLKLYPEAEECLKQAMDIITQYYPGNTDDETADLNVATLINNFAQLYLQVHKNTLHHKLDKW